ncbi:MAG: hypothetical protein AAGE43_01595 [Pseudomonadota bacterium]
MANASYDPRKVRKAMLLAPLGGVLGVLPFLFWLNLSAGQFAAVIVMLTVLCYVLGLFLGLPGYLVLKRLGYTHTRYLLGYALFLVAISPLIARDVYALVSFGPPILLAAFLFCFLRGPELGTDAAPQAA